MKGRILVYTPLRIYSLAEHVARDVAGFYRGTCNVEVLVIPVMEPDAEPSIAVEGDPVCALPVAEVMQGLLWLTDTPISAWGGTGEPFSILSAVQSVAMVEA